MIPNVAWPFTLVVLEIVVIVSPAGPLCLETEVVFPDTGLLKASRSVTVMVLEAVPSARRLGGDASTLELALLTGPAMKVTLTMSAESLRSTSGLASVSEAMKV